MSKKPETDDVFQFGIQDIIVDLFSSLSAVRELSELNCQAVDEKKLIKNALAALIQNQDMEECSFFLLNEEGYLVNLTGLSSTELVSDEEEEHFSLQFKVGEGVIGQAAETGKLQNCENCLKDSRFSYDEKQDKSMLPGSIISVPVYAAGDDLIGVLNISHHEVSYFTEWHVRMLVIYKNMLGQLITNFRLFQHMDEQISLRTVKLEKTMADLQSLKEHYQSISMIDQLTNLYNRRYFYEQVELALANIKRYGRPLCVLMLDLDHFKAVNDNYGHGFGDHVLVKVSEALKIQARDTDILVRYGGEEFVIIFNNTNCSNGELFADRIRKTIELLEWETQEDFKQTVSIGLYCLNDGCCPTNEDGAINIDRIIQNADTALYVAKLHGRNQVVTFSEDMLKK